LGILHALFGESSETVPISITEPVLLLDQAWSARPDAWAIVPFDELQPRWKVLSVNGESALDKQLAVERYPLAISIGAEGERAVDLAAAMGSDRRLVTNREPEQMTVLIMTGVTALVRGIAHRMEEKGTLYPAEKIGLLLKEADLLHISNEISFTDECPPPDPQTESLAFCSAPRYIELLRAVAPDVIELTGNHVKDYGSQPMLDTLDKYCDEGWTYFGGGKDLEDARQPIVVRKKGTVFSFIGCNVVGPDYAWATADGPGAAPCDHEYIQAALTRLKEQTDVPIATLQYWEFYQYEPTAQQKQDFRALVDAGALIVSGSQAHHPQAIEFYRDGFIHYGLGNLFFDQMWSLGTRQEVADRHVIYQGRHVSTQLLTFMLEDYSQPRLMTLEERRELLRAVFRASGW
jgi:poly-gamma-glutamate synthesis protein (capsule biosynthesis protein)